LLARTGLAAAILLRQRMSLARSQLYGPRRQKSLVRARWLFAQGASRFCNWTMLSSLLFIGKDSK
jgi:hypothetical protein